VTTPKVRKSTQLMPKTWTTLVRLCAHGNQCKAFTFKSTFGAVTHWKVVVHPCQKLSIAPPNRAWYCDEF